MTETDALAQIRTLLAARPQLAHPLRSVADADGLTRTLVRIAADNGIPIDAREIRRDIAAAWGAAQTARERP